MKLRLIDTRDAEKNYWKIQEWRDMLYLKIEKEHRMHSLGLKGASDGFLHWLMEQRYVIKGYILTARRWNNEGWKILPLTLKEFDELEAIEKVEPFTATKETE